MPQDGELSGRLTGNLEQDIAALRGPGQGTDDWTVRRFRIGGAGGVRAAVIYIRALTNDDLLQRDVLGRLMGEGPALRPARSGDMEALAASHVPTADYKVLEQTAELQRQIARGLPVLLLDGSRRGLALALQQWESRNIESPPAESGLRGPRDGFVETLNTNLGMIRRRVADPSFQVEVHYVGRRTGTRTALLFLRDVAPAGLVEEVRRRLGNLTYDGILDAAQLGQMLMDQQFNPFPLLKTTERPDMALSALLNGKVAIMVDGSPEVLVGPSVLLDFLWAADDYYTSPLVVGLIRLGRLTGLFSVIFLPALYIAVELYNPGLLRTYLALFLAGERVGLPLGAAFEIVILELVMEMIHEATLRLPAKVGAAASIVGGLIIGQAAVEARLISSVVIIVVAVGAIGSFTFPSLDMARIFRSVKWAVILFAAVFGLYGVFIATVCLVLYLNRVESLGVPYLAPVSPVLWRDLRRDFIWRLPWVLIRRRPDTFGPRDPTRGPGRKRGEQP